jgi:hypothetical protein
MDPYLHTSVPRDSGVVLDLSGAAHLVAAAPVGAPVRRLLRAWSEVGRGALELLCTGTPPPLDEHVALVVADDESQLEALLRERLAGACTGLRLYLFGDEAFVRRAERSGRDAGLLSAEVRAEVAGGRVRVWCTHCKAITEADARHVIRCAGCARALVVYHHFSRRHGAYMGFQADAEVRGEIPEARAGLPWA